MSTPRVLIDAANLHSGGGLQVAASFLDELAALRADPSMLATYPWLETLEVEASSAVVANLTDAAASSALDVRVRDRGPTDRDLRAWTANPAYDVCFSVFGPIYGRPQGRRTIIGFADGTSIYPVAEVRRLQSRKARAVALVRRTVARALFRTADRIVVEAPHVRDQLAAAWGVDPAHVDVVPNCLNSVFTTHPAQPVPEQEREGWIYVTRSHPHKNLDLLGAVGEELHRRGVKDVTFTLTLTDAEWEALDDATRRHTRTLGPVSVDELPGVYARSEGSVFPSLLESYSAAPLEAVASGLPLVASDRPFVRDVVADAACYADPTDPAAWADAIMTIREDAATRERLAQARAEVLSSLSTARGRAEAYLAIIDDEARTPCQSE